MTLRPIEMQSSMPRSQTVGKIQDQLQQRGQNMQEQIATDQKKLEEQKRKQVNETDQTDNSKLEPDKEEKRKHKDEEQQQRKKKKQEAKKEDIPHPYKGKFIDFSG